MNDLRIIHLQLHLQKTYSRNLQMTHIQQHTHLFHLQLLLAILKVGKNCKQHIIRVISNKKTCLLAALLAVTMTKHKTANG